MWNQGLLSTYLLAEQAYICLDIFWTVLFNSNIANPIKFPNILREAIFWNSDWFTTISLKDAWSFNLDGASHNRKLSALLFTHFEILFSVFELMCFLSCFLLWLGVPLPPSCGCRLSSLGPAGSCSESVVLFGLQSISLWLNLFSNLHLLVCWVCAVYVLD